MLLTVKGMAENQIETNKRLASIESKLTEVNELRRRIEDIEKYIGMK